MSFAHSSWQNCWDFWWIVIFKSSLSQILRPILKSFADWNWSYSRVAMYLAPSLLSSTPQHGAITIMLHRWDCVLRVLGFCQNIELYAEVQGKFSHLYTFVATPTCPNRISQVLPFIHKAQLCGVSWRCLSFEQILPTDLWISHLPFAFWLLLCLMPSLSTV